MERLGGIEVFVRVVETGSFTGAAARLQTAKSSVSNTVRALEAQLGVRLLERTTRHVRPTPAGRQFYARARRLLDDVDAAQDEVRLFQSGPSGRLRVAVPESFGERFILPGLAGFLGAFPATTVELISGAIHVRLVEDEFDLAIRMVAAPAPTLVARRIGSQHIILVAAQSYLSAHGVPAAPVDLLRHQCIGMAPPLPWHGGWQIGEKTIAVTPRLTVSTGEALRAAAVAGMGIVAVPDWIVGDALASGQLVCVLKAHVASESGIYAVYPTNRMLTPLVRAFVDHLVRDLRARGVAA